MAGTRPSALEAALDALGRRDLSSEALRRKLAARGYSEADQEVALATVRRTGLVDDRRYAELRAAALARRGAGDALILHDLERDGVDPAVAAEAVLLLESETERARDIAARRGGGPKTARYLAGKGFSEEAIAGSHEPETVCRDGPDALG